MKKQPRLHKFDRLARVYDDEILPIFAERFGRMMLRDLALPPRANVLDVYCGTGYPSLEILRRLDDHGRIIAIDPIAALVDVARKKAADLSGRRIFFRTESASPRLSFADDVYDLVVCNLGLEEVDDRPAVMRELARVAKPGGQVIATLQLAGTWSEFYDLFHEVLVKHDRRAAMARLEAQRARHPEPETAIRWMEEADLGDVMVEVESFTLLFRSSREFFFSPLVEFGPLAAWKAVAGKGQEMQDVFWFIKEAIDAYFGEGPFGVSVVAGCLRGTPGTAQMGQASAVSYAPPEDHEAIPIITHEVDLDAIIPLEDMDEDDTRMDELLSLGEAPAQGGDEE